MAAHHPLLPPGWRRSLAWLLSRYPTLNQPDPAPITDAVSPLSGKLDTRRLHDDHSGAGMLSHHIPFIVKTIRKRLRQGKRALGGRKHSQRFHRRDLAVQPLNASQLPRQIAPLCQRMKQEMPRLIRLVLEAEAAHEDHLERYWLACHEAVAIALLNMQTLFEALRRLTTPWFALLCLRWALRCGWEAFLGKDTFTREAKQWFEEVPITLAEEAELWRILVREAEEGPPPEPFAPLIRRWRAGELPAQPPTDRKQPWPEGAQPRGRV
ncbi:MAG TPA: hypothetical protein VH540_20025 [Ktedonobacterales bacterium]|jgi:hypothetical protein